MLATGLRACGKPRAAFKAVRLWACAIAPLWFDRLTAYGTHLPFANSTKLGAGSGLIKGSTPVTDGPKTPQSPTGRLDTILAAPYHMVRRQSASRWIS
jgi:hypothetical protein